jgi:thioredoxin-dependent peroxiredoxin
MAVKKKVKASAGSKRGTPVATAKRGAQAAGKVADKPARRVAAPSAVTKVAKKVAKKKAAAKSPTSTVHGAATAGVPSEGDLAPHFQLLDQAEESLSSDELAGQPYVLYFYPKDDTPGCTTEACGFRDALPMFESIGVRVLGVSPDSSASHARFRGKYSLPFDLLSDADKELSTAYGVWALKKNYGREYMGVVRSTFLVGADGVIRKVWRSVKVNGHVDQVQAAAAELG